MASPGGAPAAPDPAADALPGLVRWAEAQAAVRAALLTSSRARPGGPVDALSDYDVILVVSDLQRFTADHSWVDDFGRVLVAYWDPVQLDPVHGIDRCGNVIQYASGLRIDFSLWPVVLLQKIAAAAEPHAELDAGYRVLLDKDGLTAHLPPPTYTAYIPRPPSAEDYQTLVNDFLSDAPYVAKCLWRDELLPARWCLDCDMKHLYLRQALQWRMAMDQGWARPVDYLGRGLKRSLPLELWARVEACFASGRPADPWDELAETMALFQHVAGEVGARLGFAYPEELHQNVRAFVEQIRHRPRPSAPAAP